MVQPVVQRYRKWCNPWCNAPETKTHVYARWRTKALVNESGSARWRILTYSGEPSCGAGGNRTPVHQPVYVLATTIPGIDSDAETPTGRLSARGGPRSVFPESQQSFPLAVVFPTVIPHFCCRAVMDWPRATFLLTMTLHYLIKDQAARANCSSAILLFSPFYESEKLGSQTRTALLTSKPVSPMYSICS